MYNMQVDDDLELLKRMCEDISHAPLCFQPTNYWKVYEKRFLPELFNKGLKDFRRRQDSILSSFGAVDLFFLSQIEAQWLRSIGHRNRRPLGSRPRCRATSCTGSSRPLYSASGTVTTPPCRGLTGGIRLHAVLGRGRHWAGMVTRQPPDKGFVDEEPPPPDDARVNFPPRHRILERSHTHPANLMGLLLGNQNRFKLSRIFVFDLHALGVASVRGPVKSRE